MPTPTSSANGYATVADLTARKDERRVRDLIGDADLRVSGDISNNPVLLALGKAASGRVESACLVGQRYAVADLAALTGSSKEYLISTVCDLWYGMLRERRFPDEPPPESYKRAEADLAMLRKGEAVFGLAEQIDASTIEAVDLEKAPTPSGQVPVSQRAGRFFGRRMNNPNGNYGPTDPGGW